MMWSCVSEEYGNGEGEDFQELSGLSDVRRYISLTVDSVRDWGL